MRHLIAILCLLLANPMLAETGVAVIDSLAGEVEIIGKENLSAGKQFQPEGVAFQTGDDSFVVIVFSNGVSFLLSENSKLSIDSFEQTPFKARPDDFEFEPSRSQLSVTLSDGELGVAQRDPNPSSKFIVELGDGVSVDLKTKLSAIMHQGEGLGVITAIFDGHGSMTIGESSLLSNQGYRLSSGVVDHAERVRLMTDQQIEDWKPLAQRAQIALRRWYFRTPQEGVIEPVRIKSSAYRSSKPYNDTKL